MSSHRRGLLGQVPAALRLATTAVLLSPAVGVGLAGQDPANAPRSVAEPHVRHPEAVEAMDRIKSPYCPGLMLEVCTSAGGAALRDSLDELAYRGWSADSLVAWVLENHGDTLLALPPPSGRGLIAWVVPPLALVTGLGLVVIALGRMRRARPPRAEAREISEADSERLRKALSELEAEEEAPLF